jgi:hypothetical protein
MNSFASRQTKTESQDGSLMPSRKDTDMKSQSSATLPQEPSTKRSAPKSEKQIQNEIRLALGKRSDVFLWRNSVGVLQAENGRTLRAGLPVGSADLIGMLIPSGRFLSLEVKKPGQKLTKPQQVWLDMVNKGGGIAAVVTSAEEAIAAIDCRYRHESICSCGGSGQIEDDRGCYVKVCPDCNGKGEVRR